jgi:hypothetical protein
MPEPEFITRLHALHAQQAAKDTQAGKEAVRG